MAFKLLPEEPEKRKNVYIGILGAIAAIAIVFGIVSSMQSKHDGAQASQTLEKLKSDIKDKEFILNECIKNQGAEGFNIVTQMGKQNRDLDSTLKFRSAQFVDVTAKLNELTRVHGQLNERFHDLKKRDSVLLVTHQSLTHSHSELQKTTDKLGENLAAGQKSRDDLQAQFGAAQKSNTQTQANLTQALANNTALQESANAATRAKDEAIRNAAAREQTIQAESQKNLKQYNDLSVRYNTLDAQYKALQSRHPSGGTGVGTTPPPVVSPRN